MFRCHAFRYLNHLRRSPTPLPFALRRLQVQDSTHHYTTRCKCKCDRVVKEAHHLNVPVFIADKLLDINTIGILFSTTRYFFSRSCKLRKKRLHA